jgi:hypothetical protein
VGIRGVVVLHFLTYTNFLVKGFSILKVKTSSKQKILFLVIRFSFSIFFCLCTIVKKGSKEIGYENIFYYCMSED